MLSMILSKDTLTGRSQFKSEHVQNRHQQFTSIRAALHICSVGTSLPAVSGLILSVLRNFSCGLLGK